MEKSLRQKRSSLRMDSLDGARIPERFLKMDMALDLLGRHLRPDDWGYARKFASLPFSYEAGTYLWHQFEQKEARWHLTHEAIPVAREDRGAFFAQRLMFDFVCRRFIQGCEKKEFDVSLLDPYQGVVQFPQTTSVTTQSIAVFQTGHAFPPDSQLQPLPVVVDKLGYERWVSTKSLVDEQSADHQVSEGRRIKVQNAIKEFAKAHDIIVGKEWVWEVMLEVVGPGLTRNQFEKDWKLVPSEQKGVNRPTSAMKDRRDNLKEDAIQFAKDATARSAGPDKATP